MNTIILPEKNICIIDFNDVFKSIELGFLNDLYEYKLIKKDKIRLTVDVKKLFYHHVIYNLCEYVVNAPSQYHKIIYTPLHIDEKFQICGMCDCSKLNKLFCALIKKLEKTLPVLIIFEKSGLDFKTLQDKCFCGTGEIVECLNFLELSCMRYENGLYNRNFSKIKDFTKKYELKFLNRNYFDNLKTKQILYK